MRLVNIFITIILSLSITLLACPSWSGPLYPSFEGSEHIALGNSVKLFFSKNDPGQSNYVMTMPNGLKLSYGDIVSFGDFYEIEDQPISQSSDPVERRRRFVKAFQSFANDLKAYNEATQILALLHHEYQVITDAINRGEDPEKLYEKMAGDTNRQLNCITGGGCEEGTWFLKPGRYLRLANLDFDHFNDHALLAYEAGHEVAIEQAITAHHNRNIKQLEMAYAMNALACHFLSDRFAAGHIRTPRLELFKGVSPNVTGSLLAGFMHREENAYGVHVHNAEGTHWLAYGDRAFFTNKNLMNRIVLQQALQASVNEIFAAYQQGFVATHPVLDLIPYADEINGNGNTDIAPLFFLDPKTKKLMRRVITANVYDYHWTTKWWGWSTLIQLSRERGIPTEEQVLLLQSKEKEQAILDGLILTKKLFSINVN
ncbi:MAG: phospholipase [Gammaproteobacteria bacterium]|nr:phospholipase [Gammaproteobacteria bacterium]